MFEAFFCVRRRRHSENGQTWIIIAGFGKLAAEYGFMDGMY